jgi:hypothetical protein
MGQPSEEEDGLESDTHQDDTFSQASDLTSYADDPTYQGIHNFDQDKCGVIIQVGTSKGDPICCDNEATECLRPKHRKLQQDPARVVDVGYMAGLENSKGGIDGIMASYFDENDLKRQ